jgi:hypothetical protein
VAPVLDAVFTTLEVIRIGADVAASDATFQNQPINRTGDIALGAGFGALFLGSAIYGFNVTTQCSARTGREFTDASTPDYDWSSAESTHAVREGGSASTQGPAAAATAAPSASAAPSGPRAFDLVAARGAIHAALTRAEQSCLSDGGPRGQGAMMLTYQPDGRVASVVFAPPFEDPTVQTCVANSMHEAVVPPYDGDAFVLRKRYDFGSPSKGPDPGIADAGSAIDAFTGMMEPG